MPLVGDALAAGAFFAGRESVAPRPAGCGDFAPARAGAALDGFDAAGLAAVRPGCEPRVVAPAAPGVEPVRRREGVPAFVWAAFRAASTGRPVSVRRVAPAAVVVFRVFGVFAVFPARAALRVPGLGRAVRAWAAVLALGEELRLVDVVRATDLAGVAGLRRVAARAAVVALGFVPALVDLATGRPFRAAVGRLFPLPSVRRPAARVRLLPAAARRRPAGRAFVAGRVVFARGTEPAPLRLAMAVSPWSPVRLP